MRKKTYTDCPHCGKEFDSLGIARHRSACRVSEKTIETALIQAISRKGGKCIKLVAMFENGIPDRLVLLPNGKCYFVELKAPGKKPRPLQLEYHKELKTLGFETVVLDTVAAVKTWIECLP